ncbi:MAG: anti-sigma factor [Anaerolineae bacterium]|nr:anti-sigma factor [Anaerolineae bacterium]
MSGTRSTGMETPGKDCDELRDLLPAVAFGTATPEERARVRLLMSRCPEAARELAELAALAGVLAESAAPAAPPPRLKAQMMTRLAEREGVATLPRQEKPVLPPTARPRRPILAWGLAAAAALLLLATNLFWLAQLSGVRGELNASREQLTRALNRSDRALDFMSDLNTQRIGLQSNDAQLVPLATLYWNPETNEIALVTDQLPALDGDYTYQLWLIADGQPQSAGVFSPDATGWAWLTFGVDASLTDYQALGISVEPAGGSEQPTTTPLALGAIPA